jgi:hypothetical protein
MQDGALTALDRAKDQAMNGPSAGKLVFNPHDPRGTLLTLVLGVRAGLGTLNIRSLRDSGITWLALDGVDVVRMQRRAGHENVATTIAYVKQAEDVAGTLGKPFGPLPMSLVRAATDEDVRAKDRPKLSVESSKSPKKQAQTCGEGGIRKREYAQKQGILRRLP